MVRPSMMSVRPAGVVLADLVHPNNQIKTFPYAAGCVGAYVEQALGARVEVSVHRRPEQLAAALARRPATILGCTNYLWNRALTYETIRRAKAQDPALVIVVGGPNFPDEATGQAEFLAQHPLIDFYVQGEGEIPFARLVEALLEVDGDVSALRARGDRIPGVVYRHEGNLVAPAPTPRQRDLDAFPSPYLSGLLDPFFAEPELMPIVQSKRGCPFQCTFCVEGANYYSKLARGGVERFRAELEYIARRVDGPASLYIADSNFGMYGDDLELCDVVADVRRRFGWPETIEVSTGKNKKERIVEAVRRSDGAMRFGPALQTTDRVTLENVRRANISEQAFLDMAGMARDLGQRSYTELILGLPGDTVASHLESIRAAMDAGMQRIKMYPLVLLPGTEMASAEARRRFGLETRFRVLPQCHGTYRFGEDGFPVAEVVEIVVATYSMSAAELLDAKCFELSVEIFYNDVYLEEIHGLARALGLSMFRFVELCHAQRQRFPQGLSSIYRALVEGFTRDHWTERDACEAHHRDAQRLAAYARTEFESSLGTLKALALLEHIEPVLEAARAALLQAIEGSAADRPVVRDYIDELIRYCTLRRRGLLDAATQPEGDFAFAFDEIMQRDFVVDPERFRLARPRRMRFWHDERQAADIRALCDRASSPLSRARGFIYPATDPGVNPYLRRCAFH